MDVPVKGVVPAAVMSMKSILARVGEVMVRVRAVPITVDLINTLCIVLLPLMETVPVGEKLPAKLNVKVRKLTAPTVQLAQAAVVATVTTKASTAPELTSNTVLSETVGAESPAAPPELSDQ